MTSQEYIVRAQEIREATKTYPGVEIGEAFQRWKETRGEVAVMLQTSDESIEHARKGLVEAAKKPCTQEGCVGTMILESVCGGCVEGKKGYKSKWTCDECLHRELSKKEYMEWLKELSQQTK